MGHSRLRSLFLLGLGVLLLCGSLSPAFLQTGSEALSAKHPEIDGVYEMKTAETRTVMLQVYFKDGVLRTLEDGGGEVTTWEPIEGKPLEYTTTSSRNGTSLLTFEPDDEGKYTRFHIVNEQIELDTRSTRQEDFNDPQADPDSRSDRLGFFERNYQKSQYLVPMRDGVRLITHVYSPLDTSGPHPILLYRDPYGIEPYDDVYRASVLPSLYFAKAGYILVYQDIRGRARSEGSFNFMAPYIADKESPSDVDESSDAYDTIEWLLQHVPNHNGRVGVWGCQSA